MKNFLLFMLLACFTVVFTQTASADGNDYFYRYYNYRYQPRVIGFQPIITWLPQGTGLSVNSPYVYSYGGQRHVRFGVNYGFYNIPQVNTFNLYNGQYRRVR